MNSSVLQINWNMIREGDLNSFRNILIEIHKREYSLEHMIQILKHTPKYLVVEALNWNFDTSSCDHLTRTLKDPMFSGLIEDPNWIANTTPPKTA